jgi:ATP-dependent DNA ligase
MRRNSSSHHIVFAQACQLGCEGIVSKRLGSTYHSGRSQHCLKVKNPAAPAAARGGRGGASGRTRENQNTLLSKLGQNAF